MKKIVLPVILLLCWEILAISTNSFLMPQIGSILNAFVSDIKSGQIVNDVTVSMTRLFTGLTIGIMCGCLCGIGISLSKNIEEFFMPTLNFLRIIPQSVWFPLIIVFIGINSGAVITMVVIASFFPMLISTNDGIKNSLVQYERLANNLELDTVTRISKIYLPAAAPHILTAIDLSVSISFKMLIFSEFLGVSSGLGFRLADAATYLAFSKVFYLIVLIGILGVLINSFVQKIKRSLLQWM